jgi:hypothetical protein
MYTTQDVNLNSEDARFEVIHASGKRPRYYISLDDCIREIYLAALGSRKEANL